MAEARLENTQTRSVDEKLAMELTKWIVKEEADNEKTGDASRALMATRIFNRILSEVK